VRALAFNLAFPFLLLVFIETALALAVRFPGFPIPGWLLNLERQAYMDQRRILQFDPRCARYDAELTYTLRPGGCVFANDEYSMQVDVNHLGVRDDDGSLEAPEIVVLGDSFAMGWGVAQDESFPQLLEERTGMRVLNAAVSSYGTARELTMLGRIDTSQLRLLVIQYCRDNDAGENQVAVDAGGRLPISTRADYEKYLEEPVGPARYWFGKHLYRLFRKHVRPDARLAEKLEANAEAAEQERPDAGTEARLFLELLARAPADLSRVPILLVDLDAWGGMDDEFLDAVDALLAAEPSLRTGSTLRTLRLRRPLVARRHFYRLDDHLNAAGHRVVADALVAALPEVGIPVEARAD